MVKPAENAACASLVPGCQYELVIVPHVSMVRSVSKRAQVFIRAVATRPVPIFRPAIEVGTNDPGVVVVVARR